MTIEQAIVFLRHAYDFCVRESRFPRDSYDNASLILIVRMAALENNPLALELLEREAR